MQIERWKKIGILFSILFLLNISRAQNDDSVRAILRIDMNYSNELHQAADRFCDSSFQDSWCDTYFIICITSVASHKLCDLMNLETKVHEDMKYIRFINNSAFMIKFFKEVPKKLHIRVQAIDYDRFTSHDPIIIVESRNVAMPSSNATKPLDVPFKQIDGKRNNWKVIIKAALTLMCTPGHYGEHCSRSCFPERFPRTAGCLPNGTYICVPGFRGGYCEKPDACYYKPCIADATCLNSNSVRGFECICNGVDSPQCYSSFNPCVPSPCKNDGQCIRTGTNHENSVCKCSTRWTGKLCDIPISPCNLAKKKLADAYLGDLFDRGSSARENNLHQGNDSNTTTTSTSPELSVCKNGGVCIDRMEDFKFTCNCSEGWKGELCDVPDWQTFIITGTAVACLVVAVLLAVIPCYITAARKRQQESSMTRQSLVYLHTIPQSVFSEADPYSSIIYETDIKTATDQPPLTEPVNESEYCNPIYTNAQEPITYVLDDGSPYQKSAVTSGAAGFEKNNDGDDAIGPPPPMRPATFAPIPRRLSGSSFGEVGDRFCSVSSEQPLLTTWTPSPPPEGVEEGYTLPKRISKDSNKLEKWFLSSIK